MTAKVCARDGCAEALTGRQRKYCSDRCRFLAWKTRQHEPTAVPETPAAPQDVDRPRFGPVRQGAEATLEGLRTLGRLEQVDQARVAALLVIADTLDAGCTDMAALWGQYLKVEASLREVHDEPDAFAALIGALRGDLPAALGDPPHPG